MEIRQELTDALGGFIQTLNEKATKRAYRTDVRDFFSFIGGLSDDVEKERVIPAYFGSFKRRGLAPTTHRRRCASLRKFFGYIVGTGITVPGLDSRVADDLSRVESEIGVSVQHYVTPEEIDGLVSTMVGKTQGVDGPNGFRAVRNKMIVALFYGFGLKVGEVEKLYCDKLPVMTEDNSKNELKFARFLDRDIPIDETTRKIYDEYIKCYEVHNKRRFCKSDEPLLLADVPFIPNKYGGCMDVRGLRRVVEMCGKNGAGVMVTPEILRNGYVRRLRDANFEKGEVLSVIGLKYLESLNLKYAAMNRSRGS